MNNRDVFGIIAPAVAIACAFASMYFQLPALLDEPSTRDLFRAGLPAGLAIVGARLLWVNVRAYRQAGGESEPEEPNTRTQSPRLPMRVTQCASCSADGKYDDRQDGGAGHG